MVNLTNHLEFVDKPRIESSAFGLLPLEQGGGARIRKDLLGFVKAC